MAFNAYTNVGGKTGPGNPIGAAANAGGYLTQNPGTASSGASSGFASGYGAQLDPNNPNTLGGKFANAPGPHSGVLSDPGYNEDWYKKYGESLMGSPSASESLYAEGAAGSNPFYDNAQKQTIKAINDAAAARGDFNSSYTMNNIGMAVADLRGQQAHELGQLAGQADAAKLGRFNASEGYSGDAQNALERRAMGASNAYTNLANDQAGLVGGFYGEAGKEATTAQMAAIEAALKKSGLDMAQFNQLMNSLTSLGGGAIKAGV